MNEKLDSLNGLKRENRDLSFLLELTSILNSSLDIEKVMNQLMVFLDEKLGMSRGTLTLLDTTTNEVFTEVAHGLSPEQIQRGRYRLGEGVTGRVVAAGEPMVIPNVGKDPLFLNRTQSRGDLERNNISFLCVPIKLENQTIGALSVDCHNRKEGSFEDDLRLLTIICSMVARSVQLYQKIKSDQETLVSENKRLNRELGVRFRPTNIIGQSKRIADVFDSIGLVSQTKATVLLRGESGTGKELVAHAIHYNSERAEGPFIKISCAALPEALLESELFGYEKGAFTGATARKVGRFEMAHNGTLFLDEIGDVPASTQIKLLRVLQEKEFERVGGTETLRVNIRLITATNRDLEKLVREGKFREDLYYRLNVIPIFLPALRDRKEDIPLLVKHFLQTANEENGKAVKYVPDPSMKYLMNYGWPGNVRELENALTRAVILCKGDTLTPDLFPIPGTKDQPALQDFNPPETVSILGEQEADSNNLTVQKKNLEKRLIRDALARTGGSQRQSAKILGITERILGYKVKKYGLK